MENIAENRRARFDYDIQDTFEAGIALKGYEVKSAKSGRFQIAGAQVLIRGGEAWLVNAHIPPYQPKNMPESYAEDGARRLLLTKNEIKNITGILHDKSQRLIPLRAYLKNGFIKLELGIGRIRKKSDQREVLKKRAHTREMRGEMK
jgi:SsrA-binding protein